MGEENEVPLLLEFLFGESAETAQRGASARLMRWAQAFDQWLAERAQKVKPGTVRKSEKAWRQLLQNRGSMPWELTQEQIEAHAAWMEAQEYAPGTIHAALGYMAMFYRWCEERGIDPDCEPGFNPAAGVKRPQVRRYANAQLLSSREIAALLGILAKDKTPLGLREYAFTLFRLRVGVKLKDLQQLRWGQLEQDDDQTLEGELQDRYWVRWQPQAEPWPLPDEVWEAMRAYLEASGRLAGIQESAPKGELRDEDYIFAALAQPGVVGSKDRAEDWVAGRPPSIQQILRSLKLYGRRAAIPETKLSLHALRYTAIRLYLDRGGGLEEMKTFTQSQDDSFQTSWLANLPGLPENGERALVDAGAPDRAAKPFQPGDGLTHGFRAQGMPEEEVRAMLAEEVQGLGEEIAGLERLLDRLEPRWGTRDRPWRNEVLSLREEMQLLDTHTLTASWMAELRDTEERLAKGIEVDPWVEKFMKGMDRMGVEKGDPGFGEKVRAQVFGAKPELDRRAEQIASVRCSLRRTLKLAEGAEGISDYLRLLVLYGRGCGRLKRILIKEAEAPSRAKEYILQVISRVNEEVQEERLRGLQTP